jgi:hypothetical protein
MKGLEDRAVKEEELQKKKEEVAKKEKVYLLVEV